jgi:HPt (histidine-containing phosphotransfer) domain-containing protein
MAETADQGARSSLNWTGGGTVTAELFEGLGAKPPVPSRVTGLALDVPQLLDRCLGSRQLIERVLQSYGQRFSEDLELLRVEIEAGSAEQTAKVAHRLKGASANAAALELAGLAAELEAAARDEQLDRAQRVYRELPGAWTRFTAARDAFKQSARDGVTLMTE